MTCLVRDEIPSKLLVYHAYTVLVHVESLVGVADERRLLEAVELIL